MKKRRLRSPQKEKSLPIQRKREVFQTSAKEEHEDEYEKICFICHRPESVTGKMIDLPNHITVCPDCMQKSFDAMTNGSIDYSRLMNMPGVQFLNLSDLENMAPPKTQKIKKKKEKPKEFQKLDIKNIPAPHKIKGKLDEYVVGQEYAKKAMAVAVYNHYKRVATDSVDDIEIEKSNMLMIGPTGSGKTYLVKTLARLLDVPLAITDATSLTEAGYIGDDIESVVSKLLAAADNDVEKAEQGIIFIDEIDKIARKGDNPSITRDVSGEGVQQGLLKLLEGSVVNVPPQGGRKHPDQKMIPVNTKNILFICGGAFDGIEKKIAQRLNTHVVGYTASQKTATVDRNNMMQYIAPQDLKSFGLIPEIIGRLPVLTYLNPLDRDALRAILTEPKNSIIKQYIKLFEMDGIKLTFEKSVFEYIVDKAVEYKLGARGLRSIVETIMMDVMFEIPSENKKTYEVTLEYAKSQLEKANMARLQTA